MYQLEVEAHFDAAHRLPEYDGPCRRIHGHRWTVKATYEFEELNRLTPGMAADLVVLKSALRGIVSPLDHHSLNDVLNRTPTAENIAQHIFKLLQQEVVTGCNTKLARVAVYETPDTCVIYWEPKMLQGPTVNLGGVAHIKAPVDTAPETEPEPEVLNVESK